MAPVAALIVVRPCVEVNAIERNSLNADAQDEEARADFPVEAVLVHAEVGGGVAQSDEAGQRRGERSEARGRCAHVAGSWTALNIARGAGRGARSGDVRAYA